MEEYTIENKQKETSEGIYEGVITVSYTGLSRERSQRIEGSISGVVKIMRNSEMSLPDIKKTHKPALVRKYSAFIKGYNGELKDIITLFRVKFPDSKFTDEQITTSYKKYHPKIVFKIGDKVRYRYLSNSKTGIVESVERDYIHIRYGINDVQKKMSRDYEVIEE
jgi:hypothetical protein